MPPPPISPRGGTTLTELLVALLLLELAGLGALSAALTADRIGRRVGLASRTDAERWASRRAGEVAAACADTAAPRLGAVPWPGNAVRPAATVVIRCGR